MNLFHKYGFIFICNGKMGKTLLEKAHKCHEESVDMNTHQVFGLTSICHPVVVQRKENQDHLHRSGLFLEKRLREKLQRQVPQGMLNPGADLRIQ